MLDIRKELRINKGQEKILKKEQKKFLRKWGFEISQGCLIRNAIEKTYGEVFKR